MESLVKPSEFWKGKRILVTGHTGFKGSWLCLWLQSMGSSVIGYSLRAPTDPNLFEVARVAEGVTSLTGDVRDLHQLSRVVKEYHPEAVFHMAAQSLVRESYSDPVATYATNVMGTVNVLEAVRQAGGVRVVLVVTSDKCYENREWVWGYRETERMGGRDPYSNSKGCAELVASAYRHSYFNPATYAQHRTAVATARAGNVIGGGDWAKDRLIPDMVRAVSTAQSAVIRNPRAVRPWQHVLEPLYGYLLLAGKLWEEGAPFAEAWNFGPGNDESRSVAWLADTFAETWGNGASWRPDSASGQAHEAHHLHLDSSKARFRLGWRPRWSLEEGVRRTVQWHVAHKNGADMRRYSLDEIGAYQSATIEYAHGTL